MATSTSRTKKSSKSDVAKYRTRDAHATFFGSKLKATRVQQQRAKKKAKPTGLTTKQRAAEAHAYYIINHGNAEDAKNFLCSKSNNANIAAGTHAALMLMCTNPFEPKATTTAITPPTLIWETATGEKL